MITARNEKYNFSSICYLVFTKARMKQKGEPGIIRRNIKQASGRSINRKFFDRGIDMVGRLQIVDILESLNELDVRIFGFLPGDLQESGIIRLKDIPNVQKIAGILEFGTEELRHIYCEIKGPIHLNVSRNSEQDLEAARTRLTIGLIALPVGVYEMSLALWLIVKSFNKPNLAKLQRLRTASHEK